MAHRRPLPAVLALLALLTSGCLALDPGTEPALLTAREAVEATVQALPAGTEGAELVKVTALGHPASSAQAPRLTLDGRASTWLTTWWDEANGTGWQIAILPGHDLQTTTSNSTPYTTEPLGDWAVGSGAALATCLEDPRFTEIAGHEDALLSLDLHTTDQGPMWTVMATSQAENATRVLEIDARNGTLLGPGYDDRTT